MHRICKHVATNAGMYVYCFQDSAFQNYKHSQNAVSFQQFVVQHADQYGSLHVETLNQIRRNSQVVGSFLTSQISDLFDSLHVPEVEWLSSVPGDDVLIKYVKDLRRNDEHNGLLNYVKQLISEPADFPRKSYALQDIAILSTRREVAFLRQLFGAHWVGTNVHNADEFPVRGIILDHLDNFVGLESKVVIFVMPNEHVSDNEEQTPLQSSKYRIAVASRGINRVEFLQGKPLDTRIAEIMKCDQFPSEFLRVADRSMDVNTKHGKGPLQGTKSYASGHDVMSSGNTKYSKLGHPSTEDLVHPINSPDIQPCHVSLNKNGDILIAYRSRKDSTQLFIYIYSSSTSEWTNCPEIRGDKYPVVARSPSVSMADRLRQDGRWHMLHLQDNSSLVIFVGTHIEGFDIIH